MVIIGLFILCYHIYCTINRTDKKKASADKKNTSAGKRKFDRKEYTTEKRIHHKKRIPLSFALAFDRGILFAFYIRYIRVVP
jgi:hypothetical protein